MPHLTATRLGILAALALLLSLGILSFFSPSYDECDESHHTKTYNPDEGKPEPNISFGHRAHVLLICQGEFIEKNSAGLIVLFTFILTGATVGLWIATHRL